MSEVISVQDLENAKLDTETIAAVANVDTAEDTTTNRNGDVIDTLTGRLKKVAYEVPAINYVGGLNFGVNDTAKLIDRAGDLYSPLPSAVPFTTSGTWGGDDENKFTPAQNTNQAQVDQNTADISQNSSDIAQNASDISQNAADISQNTADISQNSSDIAGNAAEIVVNAAEIASVLTAAGINGLTTSNNSGDTEHDIDIQAGSAPDSGRSVLIEYAGGTSQIDNSIGTGNGGFPDTSLTLSADTWYFVFIIAEDDGANPVAGFDSNPLAVNLLADATANTAFTYTKFRRIGAVLTDASSNLRQFFQVGDHFLWRAGKETGYVDPLNAQSTVVIDIEAPPLPDEILAEIAYSSAMGNNFPSGDSGFLMFQSAAETERVPTENDCSASFRQSGGANNNVFFNGFVQIDAASTLKFTFDSSNQNPSLTLGANSFVSRGWLDNRGK